MRIGRDIIVGVAGACLIFLTAPAPCSGQEGSVLEAARTGDLPTLMSLIANGADVNQAEGDGMTPLHWAAYQDDPGVAAALLDAEARLDATTRVGGHTPLHVASRSGSVSVVRLLLEKSPESLLDRRTTNSGSTALHFAAAGGFAEVARLLLDHGADVEARESEWGQTPLVFAAAWNRDDVIRVLLDHGANPEHVTKVVEIPERARRDQAARRRAQEVLDELLTSEDGEKADRDPTMEELQIAEAAAREFLMHGVLEEEEEKREGLEEDEFGDILDYQAQVGAMGGLTPLLHAARQGHQEAAIALLDGGADIAHASLSHRTTPLLMATINGHYDLAMLLLQRGADPNLKNSAGNTPLFAAVDRAWAPRTRYPQPRDSEFQKASHVDLMAALLEAGAAANPRLERHLYYKTYFACGSPNCGLEIIWGATPFWRAARALDVEAMRLLVAHGADPNIPLRQPPRLRARYWELDQDGQSPGTSRPVSEVRGDPSGLEPVPVGGPAVFPIHAVAGAGYGQGFVGNVHRHVPGGWLRAMRYLVDELGADVNLRDHEGYTPLHHAAARGDNEMIAFLVERGADVTALSRTGQSTVDMANGPWERLTPFPSTIALLESLGAQNNHACVSC